ncbi:MAG: hypothetical protein U9O94_01385 [Nanoarchaeota archaeon]|nr:hypothetical protein [Nanoarchaeota archaeon]
MPDKEEHELITKKLNEILKLLNGNGKIGICAKVNILWGGCIFLVGAVIATLVRVLML